MHMSRCRQHNRISQVKIWLADDPPEATGCRNPSAIRSSTVEFILIVSQRCVLIVFLLILPAVWMNAVNHFPTVDSFPCLNMFLTLIFFYVGGTEMINPRVLFLSQRFALDELFVSTLPPLSHMSRSLFGSTGVIFRLGSHPPKHIKTIQVKQPTGFTAAG